MLNIVQTWHENNMHLWNKVHCIYTTFSFWSESLSSEFDDSDEFSGEKFVPLFCKILRIIYRLLFLYDLPIYLNLCFVCNVLRIKYTEKFFDNIQILYLTI